MVAISVQQELHLANRFKLKHSLDVVARCCTLQFLSWKSTLLSRGLLQEIVAKFKVESDFALFSKRFISR